MHRIKWAASARREMDQLAEDNPGVVGAIVEFAYGPLAEQPLRIGKPLRYSLEGLYSARRSEYRIVYRVDDEAVTVISVGHRRSVYRPR